MNISVASLCLVFLLMIVRRIGKVRLQIWQIMSLGAAIVLVTGQIRPTAALKAINADVMLFLFGMFVVGQAIEESGYLSRLSYRLFRRARSVDALTALVLGGMGLASALLMNDTVAVIGTPVVVLLARRHGIHAKVLLLALAFAVTTGSVLSPIGNPQNLLVAVQGRLHNPFVLFLRYLAAPTLVNLALAFGALKLFYGEHFHGEALNHELEPVADPALARLARVSLGLIVVLIAVKVGTVLAGFGQGFRLTWIALAGAAPILLFSPRRLEIARRIDWHTLVFFAAMFVLMESVWDSGFFQDLMTRAAVDLRNEGVVLALSVLVSQAISNVPLVALYMPLMMHAGGATGPLMALAAGSTIAGNLTILGAASNVIIVQKAERRYGETLSFLEFFRIGLPLTVAQTLVYWLFL